MEEDQPIKIRSDLYLGRSDQSREANLSPKEKDSEDNLNCSATNEVNSKTPDNCHSESPTLKDGCDTESSLNCEKNTSKQITESSDSPPLDSGSNYNSPGITGSPLSEKSPASVQNTSNEFNYQWSDSFPQSYAYQSKEAINKFNECYWSLNELNRAKLSSNGGLDLSIRRQDLHSPSPSPTESQELFNPFKTFSQDREEIKPFPEYESTLKSLYPQSLLFSHLPSHLLPWLLTPQFQNLVQCQNEKKTEVINTDSRESQPLDLSTKREPHEQLLTDDEMVSRVIDIKTSARGRKRADNHKKSYTDEDLHAALTAILVEKLGTRRAAQLYGIPRSTLRNKVTKLTMEKKRNKKILENREKLLDASPDSNNPSTTPVQGSFLSDDMAACETLKTILKIRLNEKLEEISRNKKTYLTGGEKQEFLGSVMSYLMENLPKLTLNADNKEASPLPLSSLILYPQLGEFIHKVVEDKFNEEILKANSNPNLSYTSNYHPVNDKPFNHLNIPIYPQSHIYNNNYDSKLYQEKYNLSSQSFQQEEPNVAFKDVLSQIINNKINYNNNNLPNNIISSQSSLLPLPIQTYNNQDRKQNRPHSGNNKYEQNCSKKEPKSPTNLGGKGSRPKRGKYRNYDRNNLVKAVKAVQSGEMSVHRAGSHFGVPHSTLEYKVKERHLHRGKKKSSVCNSMSNSPNSLIAPVITNSYNKEGSLSDIQDTSIDAVNHEYSCRDDVSIIRVEQSPCKKFKRSMESEKYETPSVSPFTHQNFPFWNNNSTMASPFMSNPFSREPLYPPNIISGQRESHKIFPNVNKETSDDDSRIERTHKSEIVQKDFIGMSPRIPIETDEPYNNDILNTILRKRMENSFPNERSTSPSKSNFSPEGSNSAYGSTEIGSSISQPGLFIFSSLFPSILAARTSLAAALNSSLRSDAQNDNVDTVSPLLKDPSVSIPVEAGLQDGI